MTDIHHFNDAWLTAWTDKDVDRLCDFYADDCVYKDPQTAMGIQGKDALKGYLTGLFAATPPMTYRPDAVWAIEGGFCGRWYCDVGENGSQARLRGFDLVIFNGDRIGLNEVYVHPLTS